MITEQWPKMSWYPDNPILERWTASSAVFTVPPVCSDSFFYSNRCFNYSLVR